MTTLLAKRLFNGFALEHTFNLKSQSRYHIQSIAPYIYMHNAPAGTFTMSIYDVSDESQVFTQSFTSSAIKAALSTSNNYAHAFYPIIPNTKLKLGAGTYRAELTSSGYTYGAESFLGWVQQHEDLNNELDYTPANDLENPLALRIKELKEGIK